MAEAAYLFYLHFSSADEILRDREASRFRDVHWSRAGPQLWKVSSALEELRIAFMEYSNIT